MADQNFKKEQRKKENMKITLFGASNYDRGGKIRWLLDELGVQHDNHWLNVDEGDLEKGPYLKINPLGRIPAVTFDESPMIESGGMAAYLAEKFPKNGLAPLPDSTSRRDYLQWMFFAVSIDSFAARISIIEDIPAGEVLDKKMNALLREFKDYVTYLGQSLEGKDYLLGNFSAADICVGYHLYFAALWTELSEIIDSDKNVSIYLKRLKERDAAQKSKVFTYGE
jgi:glutathione S-transferase